MTGNRQLYVAMSAGLIILFGSASILISQQPPGGEGAAAPAAPAPSVSVITMMTYPEFSRAHPEEAQAQIPEHYKRYRMTETQWLQLGRIFRGAKEVGVRVRQGRIGRELYEPVAKIVPGIKAEMDVMQQIHDESVAQGWWFECSFPRIAVSYADPYNATVSFDVIKHVRCSNFCDRILKRLAPFSGQGEGRALFSVITRAGGMYRQHQLYLSQEAVAYWPGLWSGDTIEARVYDVDGRDILPQPMLRSAGHDATTVMEMIYPPEIYYTGDPASAFPRSRLHTGGGLYEYLPEYRYYRRQDGRPMKLDAVEGWYYSGWAFVIPMSRVPEIDRIEAKLVVGAPRGGAGGGGFGGGEEEGEEEQGE